MKADVVILGSGPGGLQAAVHAARKKVSVVVVGRMDKSNLYWAHVENFCCIFKITGEELLNVGRSQAETFGAKFVDEDVLGISKTDVFSVKLESGTVIEAKTLILATGVSKNKLGLKREKELIGKGVSYCVECDAGFFRNQPVVVAGNGSAAASGALTLLDYASEVHLVYDEPDVNQALMQKVEDSEIIRHPGTKVKTILGENEVTGVELEDGSSIPATGLFVEMGAKGIMQLAMELGVGLDDSMKYIVADKKQRTNVEGIFAAGDVCGPPFQMAKAVGEGCVAGLEAAKMAKEK